MGPFDGLGSLNFFFVIVGNTIQHFSFQNARLRHSCEHRRVVECFYLMSTRMHQRVYAPVSSEEFRA
jgi:hypothetical protein